MTIHEQTFDSTVVLESVFQKCKKMIDDTIDFTIQKAGHQVGDVGLMLMKPQKCCLRICVTSTRPVRPEDYIKKQKSDAQTQSRIQIQMKHKKPSINCKQKD